MDPLSIKWENPAPVLYGERNSKWRKFAGELRGYPGRWAIAAIVKDNYRGALMRQLRSHGLETTSRQLDQGLVKIYARWPKDDAEEEGWTH